MCLHLLVWIILAAVAFFVLALAHPIIGVLAGLAVLGFGLMKGSAAETQKNVEASELQKALWLAKDAGAIVTGERDTFRIVDQEAFSELPAEVRMTLDLSGKQREKRKTLLRKNGRLLASSAKNLIRWPAP